MSTLAKIFVVFNLVCTVAFFGSSATLYLNREPWRQKYDEYKKQSADELKRVGERFAKQHAQLVAIGQENASLKATEANLSVKNQELVTAIEALRKDLSDRELTVQRHLTALTESQKTIQEKELAISGKDTQISQLRTAEENARMAQEKAVTDLTRLTLDYAKLSDEHSQTLIAANELQQKLERADTILAALAEKGVPIDPTGTPHIEGVVEAVNEKDQIVVLSIGKDQKSSEGFKFAVRRGGEYIGKVEVYKVFEDLSGARVVFTMPGQMIQVGDRVSTTY